MRPICQLADRVELCVEESTVVQFARRLPSAEADPIETVLRDGGSSALSKFDPRLRALGECVRPDFVNHRFWRRVSHLPRGMVWTSLRLLV